MEAETLLRELLAAVENVFALDVKYDWRILTHTAARRFQELQQTGQKCRQALAVKETKEQP